MKNLILIFSFLFIIIGCSSDDDLNYITINGIVEREVNGEGVPNQKVQLEMKKVIGIGIGGHPIHETIDTKIVITDENGNFKAPMKDDVDTHIRALVIADENYQSYNYKIFNPNEHIILKVNKYIRFKIYVKNTNPFDSNDFAQIALTSAKLTGIENFGVENTNHPAAKTSWVGTNVNSILYYNASENLLYYKIMWTIRKNGVETTGFTDNISYVLDQVNDYHFNY